MIQKLTELQFPFPLKSTSAPLKKNSSITIYLLFSCYHVAAILLAWETIYFHRRWNTAKMWRLSWRSWRLLPEVDYIFVLLGILEPLQKQKKIFASFATSSVGPYCLIKYVIYYYEKEWNKNTEIQRMKREMKAGLVILTK